MLTQRFGSALQFATEKHGDQVRKGTEIPYVSHVLQVAGLVLEYGGDEDQAIAGLLHDVVEDCDVPLDLVEWQFGRAVRNIVEGCSDAFGGQKAPWRKRKEAYMERVRREPATVQVVSACDKLHNARAILADLRREGNAVFDKFNGKKDGTLWYYRALVTIFQESTLPTDLVAELDRVVSEIEQLAAASHGDVRDHVAE